MQDLDTKKKKSGDDHVNLVSSPRDRKRIIIGNLTITGILKLGTKREIIGHSQTIFKLRENLQNFKIIYLPPVAVHRVTRKVQIEGC